MKRGRTCAALCAVAVGLLLVPVTNASAVSRASAREQAQNHRISAVIEKTRQISLKIGNLTGTIGKLYPTILDHSQRLQDLQTLTGNINGRLKTIEAAAPVILDALTKLKDGLTAAGAGLQKLGDAYQAVEYGRAAVSPGDADLTVAAGGGGAGARHSGGGEASNPHHNPRRGGGARGTNPTPHPPAPDPPAGG